MSSRNVAKPQRVVVYPVVTRIDDCDVYILEVSAHPWVDGKTHFIVSCKVKCGNRESPVFPLDVTSESELVAKLMVEIAKFKLMRHVFAA